MEEKNLLMDLLFLGFHQNIKKYGELKEAYFVENNVCEEDIKFSYEVFCTGIDALVAKYANLTTDEVEELLSLNDKLLEKSNMSEIYDLLWFVLVFIKDHELDVDDEEESVKVFEHIVSSISYAMTKHSNKAEFAKAILRLSIEDNDVVRKVTLKHLTNLISLLSKDEIILVYKEIWNAFELKQYYDSFIKNNHATHNAPLKELIVLDFMETFSELTDKDFCEFI